MGLPERCSVSRLLGSIVVVALMSSLAPAIRAVDCNSNGVDDRLDLASGTSLDCDANLVPDECDNAGLGLSLDLAFQELEGSAGRAAMGDLDGDGDEDIAVASQGIESLSILENLGGGVFGEAVALPIAADDVRKVAARDLDGDGDLDVAVVIDGERGVNGWLSVLVNAGDGSFGDAARYPTGDYPRQSVIADLDADGDVDVVTSNVVSGDLTVFANRGDATFEVSTLSLDFERAGNIEGADLDGDGRVDLVVLERFQRDVVVRRFAVLMQGEDGSFAEPVYRDLPGAAAALAVGELDGDGDVDLVVTTLAGDLVVLHNSGGAEFVLVSVQEAVSDPFVLTLADVDADGDTDAIVASESREPELGVALNRGDGTFEPAARVGYYASAYRVVLADLTGDGLDEVVLGHLNWARLTVFENLGGGRFGEAVAHAAKRIAGSGMAIFPRDLDDDGDVDLVGSFGNRGGGIAVFRNITSSGSPVECVDFVRGDANADGFASISDMITVRRYLFNGSAEPGCLDAADVDDDERLTIVDAAGYLHRLFEDVDWQELMPAPFPLAGHDPTASAPLDEDFDPASPGHVPLGCESYAVEPAAATDDLLRIGDVEGAPGEEVELAVSLTSAESIDAMQFVFRYDPAVLSIESSAESLDYSGSFYEQFFGEQFTIVSNDGRSRSTFRYPEDRPWVSSLTVHPAAGVVTVAIAGDLIHEGFEVPPGEDIPIVTIRATLSEEIEPGTHVTLDPTNGEDDAGVGPYRLRNELAHMGEARFVSTVPRTEEGVVEIAGGGALFVRGDANRDGGVDIADVLATLGGLFLGDRLPPCRDAADANDDGRMDLSDAIRTLDFLFLGGPPPEAPYPAAGPDPTTDRLWCFENRR